MANEMFDPTEPEPEQPEEQEEEPEQEEEEPEQEEQPEPEPEEEPEQEEEAPEEEEGEDPEEQHEEEQPGEDEQEHEEGLDGEDPQEEGSTEEGDAEAQPKVIHNGSDNVLDTELLLEVLQEITVPKGDPSFKALLNFVPQGSNDIVVAMLRAPVTSQYVSVVGIGDNPLTASAAPMPPFVDPAPQREFEENLARLEAEHLAAVRKKVKIALASLLGVAVVGTVIGLSVGLTAKKEGEEEEGAFDVSGKTVDPIGRDFKGDIDVIGGDAKLAGKTIASLKLLDSSGPGTFSVGMGNVIHFETSAFVKDATITQAAVGYRLTDSNGQVSKDGTLTLKFNNKPVAFDLTAPPAVVPFDVVAAAFAPKGVASVALTGVPGEGVWSVDSATNKIQFKPAASPTVTQSSVHYQFTDKTGAVSNTAKLTAAVNVFPLTGISRTIPRKFDGDIDLSQDPKLAGKTIAEVFLPDAATDGKVTVDKVGEFTVIGKSIHFKTANVVTSAAGAKVTYYLKDATGATSAQAELSLTFDNTTPVAADVTGEVKGRTAADFVQVDVVAPAYLPTAFVWKAVELVGGPTLSSGGYKVGKLGSWLVVGQKIQFEPDPTSTKPFADTRYRLVAQDGRSTEGTLTVNFPMVVAPNMMMAKRGLNQAKANVFSQARSKNPLNGDSVTLVSPVDFGYQPGTQGGILGEGGKRLHVPGEGVWTVEDDGGITFQADKQPAQPGAPSPVIYCFADTLGNLSNFAVLGFDPLNERQAAFDSLAAKTDAQFWTDLQNDTLKTPSAALDNQELLTVLAAMGAITMRMVPLAAPNPIAPAALDAACTAWSKQGKTHARLFEIARHTFDALPSPVTVPFAARFWRLRLMFQMLKREVDAAGAAAAVKPGGKH